MKQVTKKINKAQITTICLLIAAILFSAAYLVIKKIILTAQTDSTDTSSLEIYEGESVYNSIRVAYPVISTSQIVSVQVHSADDRYGIVKNDAGEFLFYYYPDDENTPTVYIPPVSLSVGSDFDYSSLYASETDSSIGSIYRILYLCSAISTPYYTERIAIPSDEEDHDGRMEALARYGFTQSGSTFLSFQYVEYDDDGAVIEGSEQLRTVVIGKQAVSGSGYYFLVDDRDCIYYTPTNYYSYVKGGLQEFINGNLIIEGIDDTGAQAPYLTPSFKCWNGTVYDDPADAITDNILSSGADIIVDCVSRVPIDDTSGGVDYSADGFDGYDTESGTSHFDMSSFKSHPDLARIKASLLGQTVGDGKSIILTVVNNGELSDNKLLSFGDDGTVSYTYTVSAIESAITETAERMSGTVSDTDKYVKVTYTYTSGEVSLGYDTHAVIKLSDLSDTDRAKFIGREIGELGEGNEITINMTYTEENAVSSAKSFVLTGIVSIFDEYGYTASTVTEQSSVLISYYKVLDGIKSSEQTMLISMENLGTQLEALSDILIGKGVSEMKRTVYNETFYYELMREFVEYEITDIKFFVVNELTVSFGFVNASERDPFYGELVYENRLEGDNGIYGLNSGACEALVRLLGGIEVSDSSSSNTAVGLSGETVAVGLTVENMEKYGLYAHKLYFVLPQGIYEMDIYDDDGELIDTVSDYGHLSELAFTLYISDEKLDQDGNIVRYIGSDMYDIVAKVDASDFTFLDEDFVEFWARRNLMMMNIENLAGLKLEFNMTDLCGTYDFDVEYTTKYYAFADGKYIVSTEKEDGYTAFEEEKVKVTVSDDAFSTTVKEYIDYYGVSSFDMDTLYGYTLCGGTPTLYPGSTDLMGVAYFNTVYEILQLTRFEGTLTEEEKAEVREELRVFSMEIEISKTKPGEQNYGYRYDFYRIDDRRVAVAISRVDENGNKVASQSDICDFYVSTFAFKKLVANYVALLNGEEIDAAVAYPDI